MKAKVGANRRKNKRFFNTNNKLQFSNSIKSRWVEIRENRIVHVALQKCLRSVYDNQYLRNRTAKPSHDWCETSGG